MDATEFHSTSRLLHCRQESHRGVLPTCERIRLQIGRGQAVSFGAPPVEGWTAPSATQEASISVDSSAIKNIVDHTHPDGGTDDTIPATTRKFAVLFQEAECEEEGYLLNFQYMFMYICIPGPSKVRQTHVSKGVRKLTYKRI